MTDHFQQMTQNFVQMLTMPIQLAFQLPQQLVSSLMQGTQQVVNGGQAPGAPGGRGQLDQAAQQLLQGPLQLMQAPLAALQQGQQPIGQGPAQQIPLPPRPPMPQEVIQQILPAAPTRKRNAFAAIETGAEILPENPNFPNSKFQTQIF